MPSFVCCIGATSIPSTTTGHSSTTSNPEKDNPSWVLIAVFGHFGFIIFAGFLIWLGGKIYVAIYGYPQLDQQPPLPSTCNCEETASVPPRSAGGDQLGSSGQYNASRLNRLLEDCRNRTIALRNGLHVPPTVINLHYLGQLPFYGVDDLAEALGLVEHRKVPQTQSRPVRRKLKVDSSLINYYLLERLPFFSVTNLVYALNHEPVALRRYFMSLLPFSGVLSWAEVHMTLWEITSLLTSALPFNDVSDDVLRECACSSVSNFNNVQQIQQEETSSKLDSPSSDSPPVRRSHGVIPSLLAFYYFNLLSRLPFFGVVNLADELSHESDLIRKYFMSLLPFSDVSNEVLRECTCSAAPKMSGEERGRRRYVEMYDDMEAAVSSPKEPFCLGEAADFVYYEDEIEKKATAPVEITC